VGSGGWLIIHVWLCRLSEIWPSTGDREEACEGLGASNSLEVGIYHPVIACFAVLSLVPSLFPQPVKDKHSAEARETCISASRNFGGQFIKVNEVRLGKLFTENCSISITVGKHIAVHENQAVDWRHSLSGACFSPEKPRLAGCLTVPSLICSAQSDKHEENNKGLILLCPW